MRQIVSSLRSRSVINLQPIILTILGRKPYATEAKEDPLSCVKRSSTGLLLGVYSKNDGRHDTAKLTKAGDKFNKRICGRLWELLRISGPIPKLGEVRTFYDLDPRFTSTTVAGLGDVCAGYDANEIMDLSKEYVRIAAGAGTRAVEELNLNRLHIEGFNRTESSAEGAGLSIWKYQKMKDVKKQSAVVALELYEDCDYTGWQIGLEKAAAQNLARELASTPSNIMTPIVFSQTAVEVLCKTGVNVEVKVKEWAEMQGMGAFLAVAKGSCQEPIFMEISYFGTGDIKERPIVLVGKGCTFDSGGICRRNMSYMWGDVTGAATIVAAIRAAASLQLCVNIRGLIPLAEHMPGCNAMKPGDIVTAYNGKHILIQDTRCEGRLMLCDALAYAQIYHPKCIIDVGTLTLGVKSGLSTAASGVFTNSERLWKTVELSSIHTGDRMWRLPLYRHYCKKISTSSSVDQKAHGWRGPYSARPRLECGPIDPSRTIWTADPCRAAAFLREFVPCGEWLHIDNYGTMISEDDCEPSYLRKGMTGRPTRTLIEFLYQLGIQNENKE